MSVVESYVDELYTNQNSDKNGFVPSTSQSEINKYINDIVDLFEKDDRIYAYAYSNGYGLGNVWPMVKSGKLT